MSISGTPIAFNVYYFSTNKIVIPDNVHVNNTNWYKKFDWMPDTPEITIGGGVLDQITNMYYCFNTCGRIDPESDATNTIYLYMQARNGKNYVNINVPRLDDYLKAKTTYGITGPAVCGPNVTNMIRTYKYCYNLTGNPACGDKVTNMVETYLGCFNLTGNPVCGPNVTTMRYTYQNCYNLTGSPACGPNVTDMQATYYNCQNLYSNMYMYSDNVSRMPNCFSNRNNSKQLIIYVNKNTTSLNTLINITNTRSLVGSNITWNTVTNNATGQVVDGLYYNDYYNITILAVDNVRNYVV